MTAVNINFWLQERRRASNLTLRNFCLATGADVSYWSEVERGLRPLPAEEEFYIKLQKLLELTPEEFAWVRQHKPPLAHKKRV